MRNERTVEVSCSTREFAIRTTLRFISDEHIDIVYWSNRAFPRARKEWHVSRLPMIHGPTVMLQRSTESESDDELPLRRLAPFHQSFRSYDTRVRLVLVLSNPAMSTAASTSSWLAHGHDNSSKV